MATDRRTEMTASEIDEFLGQAETGVLSLARGNDPYAIPISYGYDVAARRFYTRLVSTPESEKRRFLTSDPRARIVVYEEADEGTTYRSVVAVGSLERIDPAELTPETIEQYGRAKRPLFEIWAESKAALDIELYVLKPESLSGRHIEIDREA